MSNFADLFSLKKDDKNSTKKPNEYYNGGNGPNGGRYI